MKELTTATLAATVLLAVAMPAKQLMVRTVIVLNVAIDVIQFEIDLWWLSTTTVTEFSVALHSIPLCALFFRMLNLFPIEPGHIRSVLPLLTGASQGLILLLPIRRVRSTERGPLLLF